MNSKKGAADEIQRLNNVIKVRTAILIVEFIMVIIMAGLAIYLGSLPKEIPWVVELTSDGEADYKADVVTALSEWSPSDATQRYFISHYIEQLRGVSTDNNVNKENANSVYQRTLGDASSQIAAWYSENNPITRSKNEYVLIPLDQMAVVAYNTNQWKVTWRETSYRTSDREIYADQQIEAIITVSFYLPDTERRRRENPIGMYISNIEIVSERSLM
jgi:type IV secretory pathway TrbF-like protein